MIIRAVTVLFVIYKVWAIIMCVITRAVIIRVGTKPCSVFPGRKESLGGASPKKYLKGPDLVMRKEMVVVRRVTMMTVIGSVLR